MRCPSVATAALLRIDSLLRRGVPSHAVAVVTPSAALAHEFEHVKDVVLPLGTYDITCSSEAAFAAVALREYELVHGPGLESAARQAVPRAEIQRAILRTHLHSLPLRAFRPPNAPYRYLADLHAHFSGVAAAGISPSAYSEWVLRAERAGALVQQNWRELASAYADWTNLMQSSSSVGALSRGFDVLRSDHEGFAVAVQRRWRHVILLNGQDFSIPGVCFLASLFGPPLSRGAISQLRQQEEHVLSSVDVFTTPALETRYGPDNSMAKLLHILSSHWHGDAVCSDAVHHTPFKWSVTEFAPAVSPMKIAVAAAALPPFPRLLSDVGTFAETTLTHVSQAAAATHASFSLEEQLSATLSSVYVQCGRVPSLEKQPSSSISLTAPPFLACIGVSPSMDRLDALCATVWNCATLTASAAPATDSAASAATVAAGRTSPPRSIAIVCSGGVQGRAAQRALSRFFESQRLARVPLPRTIRIQSDFPTSLGASQEVRLLLAVVGVLLDPDNPQHVFHLAASPAYSVSRLHLAHIAMTNGGGNHSVTSAAESLSSPAAAAVCSTRDAAGVTLSLSLPGVADTSRTTNVTGGHLFTQHLHSFADSVTHGAPKSTAATARKIDSAVFAPPLGRHRLQGRLLDALRIEAAAAASAAACTPFSALEPSSSSSPLAGLTRLLEDLDDLSALFDRTGSISLVLTMFLKRTGLATSLERPQSSEDEVASESIAALLHTIASMESSLARRAHVGDDDDTELRSSGNSSGIPPPSPSSAASLRAVYNALLEAADDREVESTVSVYDAHSLSPAAETVSCHALPLSGHDESLTSTYDGPTPWESITSISTAAVLEMFELERRRVSDTSSQAGDHVHGAIAAAVAFPPSAALRAPSVAAAAAAAEHSLSGSGSSSSSTVKDASAALLPPLDIVITRMSRALDAAASVDVIVLPWMSDSSVPGAWRPSAVPLPEPLMQPQSILRAHAVPLRVELACAPSVISSSNGSISNSLSSTPWPEVRYTPRDRVEHIEWSRHRVLALMNTARLGVICLAPVRLADRLLTSARRSRFLDEWMGLPPPSSNSAVSGGGHQRVATALRVSEPLLSSSVPVDSNAAPASVASTESVVFHAPAPAVTEATLNSAAHIATVISPSAPSVRLNACGSDTFHTAAASFNSGNSSPAAAIHFSRSTSSTTASSSSALINSRVAVKSPSGPLPLSYSKLSTFAFCPHRYYLSRVASTPEPVSAAQRYGSALHEAAAEIACAIVEAVGSATAVTTSRVFMETTTRTAVADGNHTASRALMESSSAADADASAAAGDRLHSRKLSIIAAWNSSSSSGGGRVYFDPSEDLATLELALAAATIAELSATDAYGRSLRASVRSRLPLQSALVDAASAAFHVSWSGVSGGGGGGSGGAARSEGRADRTRLWSRNDYFGRSAAMTPCMAPAAAAAAARALPVTADTAGAPSMPSLRHLSQPFTDVSRGQEHELFAEASRAIASMAERELGRLRRSLDYLDALCDGHEVTRLTAQNSSVLLCLPALVEHRFHTRIAAPPSSYSPSPVTLTSEHVLARLLMQSHGEPHAGTSSDAADEGCVRLEGIIDRVDVVAVVPVEEGAAAAAAVPTKKPRKKRATMGEVAAAAVSAGALRDTQGVTRDAPFELMRTTTRAGAVAIVPVIREYKSSIQWSGSPASTLSNGSGSGSLRGALTKRLNSAASGGLQLGCYGLAMTRVQSLTAELLRRSGGKGYPPSLHLPARASSDPPSPRAASSAVVAVSVTATQGPIESVAATPAVTAPLSTAAAAVCTVAAALESIESGDAVDTRISLHDLAAVLRTIDGTATAVRAGVFTPKPSVQVCGMCAFRYMCSHATDTSRAAAANWTRPLPVTRGSGDADSAVVRVVEGNVQTPLRHMLH